MRETFRSRRKLQFRHLDFETQPPESCPCSGQWFYKPCKTFSLSLIKNLKSAKIQKCQKEMQNFLWKWDQIEKVLHPKSYSLANVKKTQILSIIIFVFKPCYHFPRFHCCHWWFMILIYVSCNSASVSGFWVPGAKSKPLSSRALLVVFTVKFFADIITIIIITHFAHCWLCSQSYSS